MSDPVPIVPKTIGEYFRVFAAMDDPESDNGHRISFKNVRRWFQRAEIMGQPEQDGVLFQFSDLRYAFCRVAKKRERIDCDQFCQMLEIIAREQRIDTQMIVQRLKVSEMMASSMSRLFEGQY
ncbi:hypothetical protein JTE90_004132 [Oedothorax gibbosus]|uniref:Uncharacterized protein n=1 Tax=Oedothorax gibbosus TaxID=931172 RepID=A0AAV6UDA9_9ARAC|nr:hypothetical protein JTE90_004132 [Oedothorax gibbosus]